MTILNEIREYFASKQNGVRDIQSISKKYPAMVIRDGEGYGVAIEYGKKNDISESFANCKIQTRVLSILGKEKKYLTFVSLRDSLRYEFAAVCAQFVDPGVNGCDRIELLNNPLKWWNNWKELIGNSIYDRQVYSIIAEMIALESLVSKGKKVKWAATISGSHDIEGETESFEVKSTINRYGSTITIAGQHQLLSPHKLWIYFCRLEKSKEGVSVNDLIEKLVKSGYDRNKIEKEIFQLGLDHRESKCNEKFKVLERRKYLVDDKFPKITKEMFIGCCIPKHIVQITYTIDLDGLKYTTW